MKTKLLTVLLLAIFALGIAAAAFPVRGDILVMEFTILDAENDILNGMPSKVVPGGGIAIVGTGDPLLIGGANLYFFLSLDAKPKISSGDKPLYTILGLTKWSVDDFFDPEFEVYGGFFHTLYLPETVAADDYYVKIADSDDVGDPAIVSKAVYGGSATVEVVTEDLPTITVDPTSGTVKLFPSYRKVVVEGSDIVSDYWGEDAKLYWAAYSEAMYKWYDTALDGYAEDLVEDGSFSFPKLPIDERAVIPQDTFTTMGTHKILVTLYDGTDYLGTYVDFEIKPSVKVTDPDMTSEFSILAGAPAEWATLVPHGFPKGDISADIKFIIKNIRTGEVLETIASDSPKTAVDWHGTSDEINCTDIVDAPVGTVDLQFVAAGKTIVESNALVSSEPGDPGDLLGKMTVTEGKIGDDVKFLAVKLPDGAGVDVTFEDDISISVAEVEDTIFSADANGGWVHTFTLDALPGGEYTVKLWDTDNNRPKTIGTFKVLSDVTFYDADTGNELTSVHVGDLVYIEGTAFPLDAKFKTVKIGTGTKRFADWIDVNSVDFTWTSDDFEVPHTSGGGQMVTVEIQGKDAEGKAITIESEIKVKPVIPFEVVVVDEVEEETQLCKYLDPDGEWYTFDWDAWWDSEAEEWVPGLGSGYIFAGNPMKIEGWGFLDGETVTIDFINNETGKSVGTAEITDGGKTDSDGDLDAVFNVPVIREFKFAKTRDIKVAGATKGNSYTVEDVDIDALDDGAAKLFIGLEPDGDLDFTWSVGSEARVVGVGFETEGLTLCIDTKELKDVTSKYGWFDTTVTVPSKVRDWYELKEYETDVVTGIFVQSKVVLSPTKAPTGAKVTATGTGFGEEEDVDIYWPGIEEELASVTSDSGGEFTAEFTVPVDVPGTYTILFDAEDLETAPDETLFSEDIGAYTYEVNQSDPEVDFILLGALKIVSLTMPGTVYNGTTVTISVNVQDYVGTPISGAKVTGSITPPVGTAISLTFTETAAGIYTTSWAIPADAKEGTYRVDAKASKPEAGGDATSSGSFYVEAKAPPVVIAPDIKKILDTVAAVTSDVAKLSTSVSTLATDVAGLKTSVAGLSTALADLNKRVAAIPIIPIELIYGIAIISIIAAIAAIAAVISIYRKIA